MRDTGLPIEEVIDDVRAALTHPGIGVLTAEPGAGKTTVVPLRLLDEAWNTDTILVLEPRRVAARAVARRMAWLLGEEVGDTVGWRTRDDRRVSSRTRIEVITEGILTRRLQSDPSLPGVSCVLFDEFHERSVHADLGLALALEARESIRPDLRLLVMSATIDAAAVAELIGEAAPAPVIECAGRTYPIDVRWRPRKGRDKLELAVATAVEEALTEAGDVLVFLPGVGEIKRTVAEVARRTDAAVLPLYGALRPEEQDTALRTIPGQRRVVVATDVAETSLTVDGIGSVVDSGFARRPRYDPASGLSKLVTISHSKASADQRAGRAGRLAPGVAFRLWSKMEHAGRASHDQPEILQIDLANVVLEALAWGVADLRQLRLLDAPSDAAISEAFDVLEMLGAVDDDRRITSDGRRMLALPLHPRLAAMVAAVGDGPLGWPAAVLASLLEERDVITGRPSERPVDLWTRLKLVVDEDYRVPRTDVAALRSVRKRARELIRRTGATEGVVSIDDLGRSLSLAYPDRIGQKRAGQGGRFRLANGMGAEVDKTDPLAHEDMVVVAELAGDKRNVRIRLAAGIDALDVELGFAADMTERTFFGWDDDRNDLTRRVERRLGALDFGTHVQPVESSSEATEALIDRIISTKLDVLRWTDKARAFQVRAGFVAEHRPDLVQTAIDDAALMKDAHTHFASWLGSATSRRHIEALDMMNVLRAALPWNEVEAIDRLAPTHVEFAKGRRTEIDYLGEVPKVSVRAQDAYGTSVTPSIVEGAVPVAVELLSPANRPIQITADLAAFWDGSWSEVRKDMAGRYPKHDWPEHPGAS
ncbi:MAG: ATP-dependent helicase HrpB [Verrucomicrobiales bacterium]